MSVIQKLNEYFGHNSEYIAIKSNAQKSTSFGISHYAGKVKYEASNILNKCRETLPKSAIDCLQKSGDVLISDLFASMPLPNGTFSKYLGTFK